MNERNVKKDQRTKKSSVKASESPFEGLVLGKGSFYKIMDNISYFS